MRLGGFFAAQSIEELEPLCEQLDRHGLSAVSAPGRIGEMTPDQCAAFGEEARRLGIVVGECGWWENMLPPDADLRSSRIETLRGLLVRADAMGCPCVMTLVGAHRPAQGPLMPFEWMYTPECKDQFREVVLRVLDGLDLKVARYCIEPWPTNFFYKPETIREFMDRVDHPRFGLHLDQMNMVSWETFYDTTGLIEQTFELLSDRVASVHLKDVAWDQHFMFIKWDEVLVGDGVMDYTTLLRKLAGLDADLPCFCEHLAGEDQYAENFRRLHERADAAGVPFRRRTPC